MSHIPIAKELAAVFGGLLEWNQPVSSWGLSIKWGAGFQGSSCGDGGLSEVLNLQSVDRVRDVSDVKRS